MVLNKNPHARTHARTPAHAGVRTGLFLLGHCPPHHLYRHLTPHFLSAQANPSHPQNLRDQEEPQTQPTGSPSFSPGDAFGVLWSSNILCNVRHSPSVSCFSSCPHPDLGFTNLVQCSWYGRGSSGPRGWSNPPGAPGSSLHTLGPAFPSVHPIRPCRKFSLESRVIGMPCVIWCLSMCCFFGCFFLFCDSPARW